MRRVSTLIGVGLVAAATASVVAATSGTAQTPGDRTLTFVEKEIDANLVSVDAPPLQKTKTEPPGKGDSFLFNNALLKATGTTKIGSVEGRCGFLRVTKNFTGSRAICDAVYVLSDGTITGSALLNFTDKPTIIAVTGGTGAYEGARGSGTITDRPGDSPLNDTVIHLLP